MGLLVRYTNNGAAAPINSKSYPTMIFGTCSIFHCVPKKFNDLNGTLKFEIKILPID